MAGIGQAAFVGRSAECRLLQEAYETARRGQPRIVVVEGDPGVGKSALLRRFAADVPDATLISASGDEAESSLAFGLTDQLMTALPGSASEIARDSFAVGAALLADIGELEMRSPVVLSVDDLHWCDQPSSRALLFFLRRLRADIVLAVLTTRPQAVESLGPSWSRLLADTSMVRWIRLTGLSAAEVRELAARSGRELTSRAAERLRAHTAGNPLYVSALLRELSPASLSDDATYLPAPQSYAATVLAKLAELSRPARDFVSAAAVIGIRCQARVAARIAEVTDVAGLIDETIGAGMLERAPRSTGELTFVHPLVRAAVYDDLSAARRRRLHAAAAAEFEPPVSFRHRVAAVSADDSNLAAQLIEAARVQRERGLLPQAAEYLLGAARVDSEDARAERSLFEAVELLLLAGDVNTAMSAAPAVEARPDSPYRRYTLAIMATSAGQLGQAVAELRSVVESSSDSVDPVLLGRCTSVLAYLSAILGDDKGAIHWASQARATADAPTIAALSQQALAWGHAKVGNIDQSLAVLADCSRSPAEPGPHENELLMIRGIVRTWAGDLEGSDEDLRAVLRWVRHGHPVSDIAHVHATLAELEFRRGDWNRAATHVELALSLAEDLEHGWHAAYGHAVAAHLYAARGDDTTAEAHARAAEAASAAVSNPEAAGFAVLAAAHAAWGREDWRGVATALQPLNDPANELADRHPNLGIWRYRLAEAQIRQGDVSGAQRQLNAAIAAPRGGVTEIDRLRLTALWWQQAGDSSKAKELYDDGLDYAGPVFPAALLQLDYARFLIARRQPTAAITPLRKSRDALVRLGAAGFVRDCDAALVTCGATDGSLSTRRSLPLNRLTAREQVVVRMVASGMTNREVAANLYVSIKAIEYHLGNIFDKLGIRSRRQLRTALFEEQRA